MMPERRAQLGVLSLALVGALFWLIVGNHEELRPVLVATGLGLAALVPSLRLKLLNALRELSNWSATAPTRIAAGVAVLSTAVLYGFAVYVQRPFVPTYHDEHAYLIQAQMLARGALWMPEHPLADFFETFHVFVRPVYAPMYVHGTALLYVPAVWLDLPYWLMPLLTAGAVVGMTYLVLAHLAGGLAGLLGSVMLLSLHTFRLVSIMMLSHTVMLLLGLLMLWSWLRWRAERHRGWLLLFGVTSGWALITRPLDALCFLLPIGATLAWEHRHCRTRAIASSTAIVAAGMAPFLAVQLVANIGITGHPLTTPYQKFVDYEYPGLLGLPRADRASGARSPSELPQKRSYYEHVIAPDIRRHTAAGMLTSLYQQRLPLIVATTLPTTILLVAVAVGVLGLTDTPRRVVVLIALVFVTAYTAFFASLLQHYTLLLFLPAALLLVLGIEHLARAWPARTESLRLALTVVVLTLAVVAMPGVSTHREGVYWPLLNVVHGQALRNAIKTPAVVLFSFRDGDNPHQEPVYNIDVAWPDDAPIIRAHDLGARRNYDLAAYYAAIQPQRRFYSFDRRGFILHDLGYARDFARHLTHIRSAADSEQ